MAILLHDATLAPWGAGGSLQGGAVAVEGGRIAYAGPAEGLPAPLAALPRRDCAGRLVTPGLIDAHTHAVHAGHRAEDFARRLRGESYAEIARAGGGIASTVRATRAASEEALLAETLPRIDAMIARGTTTVEIKSGYGLTVADELKMLRVARAIPRHRPVSVVTTHLAAHAVPPEYAGRAGAYLDEVALPSLAHAVEAGLADAVDAFCEGIAFSPAEVARVLEAGRRLGLNLRLHAEQLSDLGGAALGARLGALSCDHVEYLSDDGVAAMAAAGTVAGLLPGAFLSLRERQAPPVAALRAAGVPMMVATDANPGSSPMTSLPLAMHLACLLFGLAPEEALAGTTHVAARALGLADRGRLAAGQRADLVLWDARSPAELCARMGDTPIHARIFGGRLDP
jgi:imidazolonepropionase